MAGLTGWDPASRHESLAPILAQGVESAPVGQGGEPRVLLSVLRRQRSCAAGCPAGSNPATIRASTDPGDMLTREKGYASAGKPDSGCKPAFALRQPATKSTAGGLALSGYVDAYGRWNLTHTQTTRRGPRPPAPDAEFAIVLVDADDAELYREPLTRHILSDGDRRGCAARIPIPPRPARWARILNAEGHSVLDRELQASLWTDQ